MFVSTPGSFSQHMAIRECVCIESGYSRGEINMSYFSSFVTLGVSMVIIFKSMFIISHLANFARFAMSVCVATIKKILKKLCQSFSLFFLFLSYNAISQCTNKGQQSHSQEFCKCYLKAFFLSYTHHFYIYDVKQHIGAPSARKLQMIRFSLLFARLKYGSARERTELMFYLQPSI